MIEGFEDFEQLTRLGKIWSGTKKGENKPGKMIPTFRIECRNEEVQKIVDEVIGENPDQLKIRLPYRDKSKCFDTWIEGYLGTRTLIFRSNQKYCVKWLENGEYVYDPDMKMKKLCPTIDKNSSLWKEFPKLAPMPVIRINMILIDLGIPGCFLFENHSWDNIRNLVGSLNYIYRICEENELPLDAMEFLFEKEKRSVKVKNFSNKGNTPHIMKDMWMVNISFVGASESLIKKHPKQQIKQSVVDPIPIEEGSGKFKRPFKSISIMREAFIKKVESLKNNELKDAKWMRNVYHKIMKECLLNDDIRHFFQEKIMGVRSSKDLKNRELYTLILMSGYNHMDETFNDNFLVECKMIRETAYEKGIGVPDNILDL